MTSCQVGLLPAHLLGVMTYVDCLTVYDNWGFPNNIYIFRFVLKVRTDLVVLSPNSRGGHQGNYVVKQAEIRRIDNRNEY